MQIPFKSYQKMGFNLQVNYKFDSKVKLHIKLQDLVLLFKNLLSMMKIRMTGMGYHTYE